MQLSNEQLTAFDKQGYCFLPNCFAQDEVGLLRAEADKILKLDCLDVWHVRRATHRFCRAAE